MTKADLLFTIVATGGVLATLAGMICTAWATRRRGRVETTDLPGITIYKPLRGNDEELEANLRSFFELDYPRFQLLFGVTDASDPAIPVVQKLLADYPGHDARLVVHETPFGLNPKVQNIAGLESHRRHEIILISDSNVRVRPSYLRETVCYLSEPGVGLVTNLFHGTGERRFGAILENLQLNGQIAGAMTLAAAGRITCVVGKSMMIPARVLDEVGGLVGVRNLLAEDQVLALRIRKAGYAIRFSHHVIANINRDRDLRWFLNRHSRWYKIRFRLARVPFLFEPWVNLGGIGLLWALTGDSALSGWGCAGLLGLAMVRDALQSKWLRGSYPDWRHLWLSPVKDLFLLPLWIDALFNRGVYWRGHRLMVGHLTRLRRAAAPREVRDRVRRIRRLRSERG